MSFDRNFNFGPLDIYINTPRPHLCFTVARVFDLPGFPKPHRTEGGRLLYQLRDDQFAALNITGTDKRGFPVSSANIDLTKLTVSTSHPEFLTAAIGPRPDTGQDALLITPVAPGVSQLNGSYDKGDGSPPITGQLDIEVVTGDLANLSFVPGDTFPLNP